MQGNKFNKGYYYYTGPVGPQGRVHVGGYNVSVSIFLGRVIGLDNYKSKDFMSRVVQGLLHTVN